MAKVQFDEEGIKNALQSILNEIHDTDDPSELNELRRIFRKYVPVFSRAYVAGLLLKKARITGNGSIVSAPPRRDNQHREARQQAPAPASPRSEGMTTLFVGIGRTRRVYPRDLMGLLIDQCGLQKDQIGSIKILDNYSFVDIGSEKAQAVIDVLNNVEYRGRTLSVNFAKKKE